MKAFFGAMFGSAMLLASAGGAFAAGGYLQASSEEDQIVKEANKPQLVTMPSTDAAKGIKNNKGVVILIKPGPISRLLESRLAAGAAPAWSDSGSRRTARTSTTATANRWSLPPTTPPS